MTPSARAFALFLDIAVITMLAALPAAAQSCFDPAGNNSPGAATTIMLNGSGHGSQTGFISPQFDVDWYRAAVPTSGTLIVTMQPPAGTDYDLELYDFGFPTPNPSQWNQVYGFGTTGSVGRVGG